jgi:hypothetical protein
LITGFFTKTEKAGFSTRAGPASAWQTPVEAGSNISSIHAYADGNLPARRTAEFFMEYIGEKLPHIVKQKRPGAPAARLIGEQWVT